MKDRKRWKGFAALAMAAAMLFSQTAVYAEEGQAEAVGQAEIVEQVEYPCVFYDLYARTESGKPMDGIQILMDYYDCYGDGSGDGMARVYYYSKVSGFT